MITSLAWIPKGVPRRIPVRFELSQEEYSKIKKFQREEERAKGNNDGDEDDEDDDDEEEDEVDISELPPELRMDEYDNDYYDSKGNVENEDAGNGDDAFAIMEYGETALAVDDDVDSDDAEDDEILPTDSLLVVAVTEDDYSHLEGIVVLLLNLLSSSSSSSSPSLSPSLSSFIVQVLTEDLNLYVHHDIALPEFPLCLAWMDCPPFQQDGGQNTIGSYIAVGTFNPAIEIWNLDVLDPLEPTAILGGEDLSKKKKNKKGNDANLQVGSHEGAVMGLSANKVYRQFLASGSADHSVKIWDVTKQTCSHTFVHHKDKVQSVQWHPIESWLLASGSFDKTIALLDCRSASQSASYKISADIESMTWDPFSPFHLYCSLENGIVTCIDCRNTKKPLFTFQAHDETTSSISFSSSVPGMLATASVDKSVKIWDALKSSQDGSTPKLVAYKTLNVGKLFAMSYYSSDPFTLAAGGDAGMVFVWESDEQDAIAKHFSGRINSNNTTPNNNEQKSGIEIEKNDEWMDEPMETDIPKKKDKKKSSKKK